MFRFTRALVATLLALGASASFASRSIAPPTVDREAIQRHQDDKHMAMAMWFSPQLIELSGKADPVGTREIVRGLEGYTVFAIMDVKLDTADMTIVPGDREQMRASAHLRLGDDVPLSVLREQDVPTKVRVTVGIMKPILSSMLGKFGDAMEFVVFKDADEHGKSRMTAHAHVTATLDFDKESFAWTFPSVSQLPLRIDTATGDTFPGDFEFSPFTGHKLETAK